MKGDTRATARGGGRVRPSERIRLSPRGLKDLGIPYKRNHHGWERQSGDRNLQRRYSDPATFRRLLKPPTPSILGHWAPDANLCAGPCQALSPQSGSVMHSIGLPGAKMTARRGSKTTFVANLINQEETATGAIDAHRICVRWRVVMI